MIGELVGYSAIIAGITVGGIALYTAMRYRKFFYSFLFLGLSFLSYGITEAAWLAVEMAEMDLYPSTIDAGYVAYFGFAILHVLTILRIMKGHRFNVEQLVIVVTLTVSLIGMYGIASLSEDIDHEVFLYGGFFATLAAILASLTLIAMTTFYPTALKMAWLFIGSSIFIASLTDVWYYAQENVTGYNYVDFPLMDGLWIVTDIIMVAGIVLHRRAI